MSGSIALAVPRLSPSGTKSSPHTAWIPKTLMPIFSVKHSTIYRYAKPVRFGEHRLMFRPRDSFDQRLLRHSVSVHPEPKEIRWIHDVFGNCVAVIDFRHTARELRFETDIGL